MSKVISFMLILICMQLSGLSYASKIEPMTLTVAEFVKKNEEYRNAYVLGIVENLMVQGDEKHGFYYDVFCLKKWYEEAAQTEMLELAKKESREWSAATAIMINSHKACPLK